MSLTTNLTNLVTRIATELKSHRALINDLAEVSGGAAIDDGAASASTVWSSSKTGSEIGSAVAALVASSPEALDTLQELAAALGDDPNFATTITNALASKVNAADVGSTTTDFVAAFEAGLV